MELSGQQVARVSLGALVLTVACVVWACGVACAARVSWSLGAAPSEYGVAVSTGPGGDVWVRTASQVRRYSSAGRLRWAASLPGPPSLPPRTEGDVAVLSDGTALATQRSADRVVRVSADGVAVSVWPLADLVDPAGIAADPGGGVILADANGVRATTPNATIVRERPSGFPTLQTPASLAVLGSAWFAPYDTTVRRITMPAGTLAQIGTPPERPSDAHVGGIDPGWPGTLWVADTLASRAVLINTNGDEVATCPAAATEPSDIAQSGTRVFALAANTVLSWPLTRTGGCHSLVKISMRVRRTSRTRTLVRYRLTSALALGTGVSSGTVRLQAAWLAPNARTSACLTVPTRGACHLAPHATTTTTGAGSTTIAVPRPPRHACRTLLIRLVTAPRLGAPTNWVLASAHRTICNF